MSNTNTNSYNDIVAMSISSKYNSQLHRQLLANVR